MKSRIVYGVISLSTAFFAAFTLYRFIFFALSANRSIDLEDHASDLMSAYAWLVLFSYLGACTLLFSNRTLTQPRWILNTRLLAATMSIGYTILAGYAGLWLLLITLVPSIRFGEFDFRSLVTPGVTIGLAGSGSTFLWYFWRQTAPKGTRSVVSDLSLGGARSRKQFSMKSLLLATGIASAFGAIVIREHRLVHERKAALAEAEEIASSSGGRTTTVGGFSPRALLRLVLNDEEVTEYTCVGTMPEPVRRRLIAAFPGVRITSITNGESDSAPQLPVDE